LVLGSKYLILLSMRILKENSTGLIIDIQERLLPHMIEEGTLLRNTEILIKGLQALDIPIIVTEQYTKGLGFTVDPVKCLFPEFHSIEKISFSCCDDNEIDAKLKVLSKRFVIIAGIETHVCVLQTAIDLLDRHYMPVIIEDCVSSRKINDKQHALARIRQSGGIVTTYESILFELTRFAGNETFKAISKLVK
jgi:nicotinamidase-related amidase